MHLWLIAWKPGTTSLSVWGSIAILNAVVATPISLERLWYPRSMTLPVRARSHAFSLLVTGCILCGLLVLSGCGQWANAAERDSLEDWKTASRDELKGGFDEVARNLGYVEAAYYTYTLEFREVPESAQAMIDTGHLRVKLKNPYTGNPLKCVGPDNLSEGIRSGEIEAGDIWFHPDVAGGELHIAGLYLDPNKPEMTKWMRRDILRYYDPSAYAVVFADKPSEKDRLVRISMEHMLSGIEEYEIRFGRFPETFQKLTEGDMRVVYPNPCSDGEMMQNSKRFRPGHFYYDCTGPDDFILIGWGEQGATWFHSEAPGNWGIAMTESKKGWTLVEKTEAELAAIQDAGPDAFVLPTDFLINRSIAMEYLTWQRDEKQIADWAAAHPECLDCGSTHVFWAATGDGGAICTDERTGQTLKDCCCEELPKQVVPAPEPPTSNT